MTTRLITLCASTALFAFAVFSAHARWKAEYAQASPAVQDWYSKAELTPEAQKRFPFKSCCSKSDRVRTQFRVDRSTGADQWFWFDQGSGKWRKVPDDIIHWGESGPNGEAVLFVNGEEPVCFWPPESGN